MSVAFIAGSPTRALQAQKALPFPAVSGEVSPPDAIAGLRDARPNAPLEFSRAWLNKVDDVRRRRADLSAEGELDGLSPWQAMQRGAALSGTLRVPVIPILYSDVKAPFAAADLRARLFGNSRGDTISYASYWEEVSAGLLQVEGEVTPWIRMSKEARHYLPETQYGWARFGRTPELRIEALNHAVQNIPAEQLRMHMCWGNYGGPHHHDVPFAEIIDLVFKAKPQMILFEAANPRHAHEWSLFEKVKLPDGKILCPGVIECQSNYVEHPELVAQRIKRYADLVGRENVMAATDCGFSIHVGQAAIDPQVVWLKFKSLAEGARIASEWCWKTK